MIELGQVGTPAEFERRLRTALRDPTLTVLHWSDSAGGYLDGEGQLAVLPETASGAATRRVTTLPSASRAAPESRIWPPCAAEQIRATVCTARPT